jgi:hypothetical protein
MLLTSQAFQVVVQTVQRRAGAFTLPDSIASRISFRVHSHNRTFLGSMYLSPARAICPEAANALFPPSPSAVAAEAPNDIRNCRRDPGIFMATPLQVKPGKPLSIQTSAA